VVLVLVTINMKKNLTTIAASNQWTIIQGRAAFKKKGEMSLRSIYAHHFTGIFGEKMHKASNEQSDAE
jgi:hypothetical protein